MAFSVTETGFYNLSVGNSGLCILTGTYTNTAASTGGQIKPGANATNVSGSAGIRKIISVSYTSTSATPSEVQSVKTFDTTQSGEILTITTAANQTGEFTIIGQPT